MDDSRYGDDGNLAIATPDRLGGASRVATPAQAAAAAFFAGHAVATTSLLRDSAAVTLAVSRVMPAATILPYLLAQIGIEQTTAGRWLEAKVTFDQAIDRACATGQSTVVAAALAGVARVEARGGRAELCRKHGHAALALARELRAPIVEVWALAALAELEFACGDMVAAVERYEEQERALDRSGLSAIHLSPAPELVELYLRSRRYEDARAVAEPFLEAARRQAQSWSLARAARCRALLASNDDVTDEFERALALHSRTRDAFERGRTELAYGARLRRAGLRARARELLRTALGTFEALGAAPWAELARLELQATAETARRRDVSTADDLTVRELTVSRLLAGGKTTREAAAALFLSPKTIEYHLRNVYLKLGVNTRAALAASLAGQT